MKSIASAFKQSKKLILGIALAYVVCLIVCGFYIYDVNSSNRANVKEAMDYDVNQASALTQTILSDLVAYCKSSGEKIESDSSDDDTTLVNVLVSVENSSYFREAMFVSEDGMITTSPDFTNTDELRNLWRAIMEESQDVSEPLLVESTFSGSEGTYELVIPVPVKRKNAPDGTLVAIYDCAQQFDLSIYSAIRKNAKLYLLTTGGVILAQTDHPDYSIKEMKNTNFFDDMLRVVDGSASSKKLVQNLKVNLFNPDVEEICLSSKAFDSESIYVKATAIEGIDRLAFVILYDLDIQMTDSNRSVRKTWIVLAVILLATLAANFLVWNYLRNVTQRVEKLAYMDDVTKGKNLNYFRTATIQILEENGEVPYIIQRFDIANFRYLNEAYGHIRADEILKACIDIYDELYTDKELCVRMNSDQFVSLTINDAQIEEKRAKYEEALNRFAKDKGIKYPIKLKFGIYQIRKSDNDVDVLIDRANVARKSLARSKTNFLAVYSDNLVQTMRKAETIEAEKEKALATGEFKVYLQAKWDIINDRVAGAEALVRWIKADGNMVFPDEFIPVFEENGFIEKLDFYMLESVCKRMSEVIAAGGTAYPVSVNQSRVLLHNPDYIDKVKGIFEKYRIPTEYVELEVTETSLADGREHMKSVLEELKEINIKLDMDDFGSGYSSLNILKDMPFDVLKIDREFFSESITSSTSTLILQKIVEMANALGLEVICEGVENQQQVDLLKEIGCKRVQGYFYARPVPMEDYIGKYCNVPMAAEARA